MGRTEVPEATRRELWRVAMGICARCRVELDPRVRGTEPTATVAHIIALEDGGPRADPTVTIAERNAIGNLILLCPGCHDMVDKNTVLFTVDELRRIKGDHESRMATLRQISRSWNQRFVSVDYVNLPRLAMLPGGIAVQHAATASGLDSVRPFAGQGIAPGLLVSQLRPLLESWSQHAIALEPATVPKLCQGALVSFEVPMAAGKSAARTRAADAFPQLLTKVAGRHITVRFDPQWLTTSTARANVFGNGVARIFAGLARVTMVSEERIEMSALVFGQPEPAEIAAYDFAVSSGERETPSIEMFEVPDPRRPPQAPPPPMPRLRCCSTCRGCALTASNGRCSGRCSGWFRSSAETCWLPSGCSCPVRIAKSAPSWR